MSWPSGTSRATLPSSWNRDGADADNADGPDGDGDAGADDSGDDLDLILFGAHKEELVATLAPGCLHMCCLKWFDDDSNFLNQYDVSCDFHT